MRGVIVRGRLASDRAVRGGGPPGSRVLAQLDALDLALHRRAASRTLVAYRPAPP